MIYNGKKNIYVLLSNQRTLEPNAGDKINEIMIYKAMSKFANVYYNGFLFDPNKEGYNILDKKIKVPIEKYDFYYIRNNFDIFNKINGVKATVGGPYNKKAFAEADAIVAFTPTWKECLDGKIYNEFDFGVYDRNMSIRYPKRTIVFDQMVEDRFVKRSNKFTRRLRQKLSHNGEFIIGFSGRIDDNRYPNSLLLAFLELNKNFPGKFKLLYLGKDHRNKKRISKNSGYNKLFHQLTNIISVPYKNMDSAMSVFDVFIDNNSHYRSNWTGNRSVLEAMACGIPIISNDFLHRRYQFGEDYPLFLENNKDIFNESRNMQKIIKKLYLDKSLRQNITDNLLARAIFFKEDNVSKMIYENICKVTSWDKL